MRIVRLALALVIGLTGAAGALEVRRGGSLIVEEGERIDDDLYIAGDRIEVRGHVTGDLFVAGRSVRVRGQVDGDVFAAAEDVVLEGPVRGSVRAAGEEVRVEGEVGEDVLVAANEAHVVRGARVGRDLAVAAQEVLLAGSIGRRVLAAADEIEVRGDIAGEMRARAREIEVESGARIGGRLEYASENEARIDQGAQVGSIERVPVEPHRRAGPAMVLLGWLRMLVGFFVLGLLFVWLAPAFARRASRTTTDSVGASLGLGALVLIAAPLVAMAMIALGFVFGGWWIGLALLGLLALAFALGMATAGLGAGRWLLERAGRTRAHAVWALLAGLVVLGLVALVPFVGPVVVFVAAVIGLGALTLSVVRARRHEPVPAAAA